MENILDTVQKYNKLATSLAGHHVKDKTMMQFLAYCISSKDVDFEVIEAALETLLLLTTNNCNISHLIITYGVLEAVEFAVARDDLPNDLKVKATQLHKKLDCKDAPAYCTRSKSKTPSSHEFKRIAKPAKIILHVHGLNKECHQKVESTLIRVKGVVSVVIDVDHQRCTLHVYQTLTANDIAKALMEETEMEAKLVARNKSGHEILKPLIETSNTESEDDLPPYLNEEDSPIKEKAVSQMFIIKDKTCSWLNSAAEFLQKSFYW